VLCRAVILAIAALGAAQAPQQPPRFNERVDVSTVVVDARVIDELGAPVLGLMPAEFFVTIGGKPATVQSLVWTGAPASTTPQAPVANDGPAAALSAAEPGQLVVLLFQKSLVNDRARGYLRMVGQSRQLVRDLPASSRVAVLIFDTSLAVWSDFTTDRTAIDTILSRKLLHQRPPASVLSGSPSLTAGITPEPKRIGSIERAFESIGRALAPLPGSKAIAFIGYGMGKTPFGVRQDAGNPAVHARIGLPAEEIASESGMDNDYRRASRALTAARVSVFSLDITNADTHSLALGMQAIAADTGGFYSHSLDFPEKPMRFLAGALTGHYVLFVEPPADAADRTLEVTVSRRAYVYFTSSYKNPQ
jgi:VWFA-related protein